MPPKLRRLLVAGGDKSHRGAASQFFVAGELCRRGFVAVITMGGCPNTDILCSNPDASRFAHIQVKTFHPGNRTCTVGQKAEKDFGKSFFWILSGIPAPGSANDFLYYVIPSADMAKNVCECFKLWCSTPGVRGQAHNSENKVRAVLLPPKTNRNGWDLSRYLNRWDLIESQLK